MKKAWLFLLLINFTATAQDYDVCVYGGTAAGVVAAYTVARQHKKVLLIEPGKHLGGLTTGGLGYTDIGNKYAITGLARNVYRRLGTHYGKFETWIFEPHVAEQILNQYISEASVPVWYQYRIVSADKQQGVIQSITLEQSASPSAAGNKTISAKQFIDCSYEGDLMAKAGVSYIVGREDNRTYNETWNGVQLLDKHQFPDGVDPYKIPGDSSSGLLWGISNNRLLPNGTGNKMVQAYNFRICLTNEPGNRVPITEPDDYDASRYELLLRVLQKKPAKDLWSFLKFDLMPNHKTDINNNGPFSTDMIGMNYDYPDADYTTRAAIIKAHENYVKGLLYFIGHDPRMPVHLRELMLPWGYPKDEYTDNNHWSPQAYIRESRRMIGDYVMTQANCEGRAVITDGVGMAAYTMDSHNCQRLLVNGMLKNEGDVQKGGFGPYPVSYRSLIPKAAECTNLLVPVCLSASHIAYGSIRMEPVFMVLAQSSAVAACMAIDSHQPVQQVDVSQLQQRLVKNPLMDGSTPEVLVDNDDHTAVTSTGNWTRQTTGSYGPSRLSAVNASPDQCVSFTPHIEKAGNYTIYSYVPAVEGAAPQTLYTINNNGVIKTIALSSHTKIEGQTSGEWMPLGTYRIAKGKKLSVSIHPGDNKGVVIADALLLVPVK